MLQSKPLRKGARRLWCIARQASAQGWGRRGTGGEEKNTRNMSAPDKTGIIAQFRINEKDTGSSEVQIALLTARIKHLTEHLRAHAKDFHSRRGLIAMTSRRRKLLDYLKNNELDKYTEIVKSLGLRH
jgi:small subunit ribosomal protein S15